MTDYCASSREQAPDSAVNMDARGQNFARSGVADGLAR